MSRDQQRLVDYLMHIVEAIDRINRYIEGMNAQGFLNNQLVQDAVIRNLEIIGEASRNVEKHYPLFASEHSELPLSSAYQMRNAIAHGYFKVDYAIVWKTIQADLPTLYQQVQQVTQTFPNV